MTIYSYLFTEHYMQDQRPSQAQAAHSQSDDLASVMNANTQAALGSDVASVLKNTYMLLGLTLAFSAAIAYFSMDMQRPGFMVTLIGFYGLFFLTAKLRDSVWGLASTFALTGFMGYTLGPIIGMFAGAGAMPIVMNALGLTAFVFFGLSAYALTTRKDFSFLAGFLTAGFFVLIGAMVLGFFMQVPGLQLAISSAFVLFSSAMILYQTGEIIHGGERNYIMATIGLYVSIYNIFVSLLSILSSMSGDD
jgi:modulator of FtsH protease